MFVRVPNTFATFRGEFPAVAWSGNDLLGRINPDTLTRSGTAVAFFRTPNAEAIT